MLGIIALVVGLLGMFGLWWLAWQLWNQALATPPTPSTGSSSVGQSTWRNEPTPERSPQPTWSAQPEVAPPPAPPPDERTEIEEAPVMREHASSSANTAFFNRTEIAALIAANVEKTEILLEEDVLEEPTLRKDKPGATLDTVPSARMRKTKFFPGPPPPRGG